MESLFQQPFLLLHIVLLLLYLFTLFIFFFCIQKLVSCLLLLAFLVVFSNCVPSLFIVSLLQHNFSAPSTVHISFPTSHTLSTTHPCHPYHSSHATISHPFLCISPCLQLHAYYLVSAYHHAFSSMPLAHFSFLIITSSAPYLTISLILLLYIILPLYGDSIWHNVFNIWNYLIAELLLLWQRWNL